MQNIRGRSLVIAEIRNMSSVLLNNNHNRTITLVLLSPFALLAESALHIGFM
jgi:hypothetical protein